MSDPLDTRLTLTGSLESYVKSQNSYVVYTHAARTRQFIGALFASYLVLFGLFLHSLTRHFREMRDLPPVLAELEASSGNMWLGQVLAACAVFGAFCFLVYFLWAFLDIWGLQVCVSPSSLHIQNTLTGTSWAKVMGVGRVEMSEITELRGSRLFTYVGQGNRWLRFSPVENVDQLIASILSYAPQAKVSEKPDRN